MHVDSQQTTSVKRPSFGVPMHTELPNLPDQQDSLDESEAPDTNATPLAAAQLCRTNSEIIRTQREDVYIFRWLLIPLSHIKGHTAERHVCGP